MKIRVAFSFLVLAVALSVLGLTAVAEPSAPAGGWTDDFDSPTLDSRWFWVNEDPSHWSLTERPGFMRITAQEGGENLLLQAAPADDYVIETRLLFEPTQNIQRAGLFIFQDRTITSRLSGRTATMARPDVPATPSTSITSKPARGWGATSPRPPPPLAIPICASSGKARSTPLTSARTTSSGR